MANENIKNDIKDLVNGNILDATHIDQIAQSIFWNYEGKSEGETPTSI